MQCLREVQLKIPRHNPVSDEIDDASARQIGVPLMELQCPSLQQQPTLHQTEQNIFLLFAMVGFSQPLCHAGVIVTSSVMMLHRSPEQPFLSEANNGTDVNCSRDTEEHQFGKWFTSVSQESQATGDLP